MQAPDETLSGRGVDGGILARGAGPLSQPWLLTGVAKIHPAAVFGRTLALRRSVRHRESLRTRWRRDARLIITTLVNAIKRHCRCTWQGRLHRTSPRGSYSSAGGAAIRACPSRRPLRAAPLRDSIGAATGTSRTAVSGASDCGNPFGGHGVRGGVQGARAVHALL